MKSKFYELYEVLKNNITDNGISNNMVTYSEFSVYYQIKIQLLNKKYYLTTMCDYIDTSIPINVQYYEYCCGEYKLIYDTVIHYVDTVQCGDTRYFMVIQYKLCTYRIVIDFDDMHLFAQLIDVLNGTTIDFTSYVETDIYEVYKHVVDEYSDNVQFLLTPHE